MADSSLFYTSDWKKLSLTELLVADDEFARAASELPREDSVVRPMPGWHFEQICHLPALALFVESRKIATVDHWNLNLAGSQPGVAQMPPAAREQYSLLLNTPIFSGVRGTKLSAMHPDEESKLPRHAGIRKKKMPPAQTLLTELEVWIGRQPARAAKVIRLRYAIDRDAAMTLQDIGRQFGVTRERIRQIELKAIKNFIAGPYSNLLFRRMENLLGGTFLLSDTYSDDEDKDRVCSYQRFLLEIVKRSHPRLQAQPILDTWMLGHFDLRRYFDARKTVFERCLIDQSADLEKECQSSANSHGVPVHIMVSDIKNEIRSAQDSDGRHKISLRKMIAQVIELSTKDSWTVSALQHDFVERFPDYAGVTVGNFSNALNDLCIQIGRGTYIKTTAFHRSEEADEFILEALKRLMVGRRNSRQWHASEVSVYIENRGRHRLIPYGPYSVYESLSRQTQRFRMLGRLVFVLREYSTDSTLRLDIHELAVDILRSHGAPLGYAEVLERIQDQRGLGTNKQIHHRYPITTNGFGELYLLDYGDGPDSS